jgi:hypothetical protein
LGSQGGEEITAKDAVDITLDATKRLCQICAKSVSNQCQISWQVESHRDEMNGTSSGSGGGAATAGAAQEDLAKLEQGVVGLLEQLRKVGLTVLDFEGAAQVQS